ncbi:MAG TPA: aminotransferase class IV, partial [Phycisphaerales bacterium]|nr:aminotransferase class IV [Phycisphaerales bacterium]
MDVWLNGKFVPLQNAQLSAFDAGIQHSIGLFETMLAANGQVFRAQHHMDRLARSARELGLSDRLRIHPLIRALHLALEHNKLTDARVRLTITAGDTRALLPNQSKSPDPTILISTQPPTTYPDAFFTAGVPVVISQDRENPFSMLAGHKTLSYWPRIRALQLAARSQAAESLWFSLSGHIVSGSVSNVFVIRNNHLLMPFARTDQLPNTAIAPALPGITRQVIIELARELELPFRCELLTGDDLLSADEVFLTNSSWGVLPVIRVHDKSIA